MSQVSEELSGEDTQQGSLGRSSLVMLAGSVGSRMLGIVRASLLVAIIGTETAGDAFNLANTLPNVFYMLAAGGILNSVLIPALTRAMKLEDGGKEFTDRVVTTALVAMAVITVLVLLGAGVFVSVLSGNRSDGFQPLALAFALICLPQIFFYGVFALLGQILNVKGRFGAFAWAPFVANVVAVLGLVIFIVIFPEVSGAGRDAAQQQDALDPEGWTPAMIWLFAGSATVSVVAQALCLVPALRRAGYRYRPRFGLQGLGGVSRLALWAFAGLAISQVGFFNTQWVLNKAADRANRPPDDPLGATSVYSLAFTIFMLPHAFIAVSIITALFPRLSAAAAAGDIERLKADFRRGLMLPMVANVPVMVFIMVAAAPIVAFIYSGTSGEPIVLASIVLVVMVLGIVPFGIDLLCYRLFFAIEDGKSPLLMQAVLTGTSLLSGAVTLLVDPKWAIAIVAAGQTLGNVASSATGVYLLRKRFGSLGLGQIVDSTARIGVAAAVAGLLASGTITVLSPILGEPSAPPTSAFTRLFTMGTVVSFSGVFFVVVYVALAHVLKVREIRDLADMVRRRVGG